MERFMLPGFEQRVTGRMPAPKVSLATRSHVESMDAGLVSVAGAREVISSISSRRFVTKLILGHNDLGDDGCEVLFDFLCSDDGRKYQIAEISLNSNRIGNRGLLAISAYLRNNATLKELFLQNNAFFGDPEVTTAFTLALNSSCLETLSLTTNPQLSDTFIAHFLPLLDCPHLREVHLSVLGLTHASSKHIIEFITSPRCRLHILKANGNTLRLRAVRSIVRAVARRNFTLIRLEMYATGLLESSDVSSDDGDGRGANIIWQDCEKELKRALGRNDHLKRLTEKEALGLLRYSRAVLLRPKGRDATLPVMRACSDSCSCIRSSAENIFSSIGAPYSPEDDKLSSPAFPFTRLPTELQLHILSFLAPILSSAQRIRIYTYASSPVTLPSLLPCLPGKGCIPDPTSLQFGFGSVGMGMMMRRRGGGTVSACANGKCMGAGNSVLCRREEERAKWLAAVRCNAFELEDDGDGM